MKVYICTVGERGEGYGIHHVFSDETKAFNWLWLKHEEFKAEATEIKAISADYHMFIVAGVDHYAVKTWEVA